MNSRCRYKNAIGMPLLSYTAMVGLLGIAFGCGFAYLKNQVHHKEAYKLSLKKEMRDLVAETNQIRNQVLAATTAEALRPVLQQRETGLIPIPASAVLSISMQPNAKSSDAAVVRN